MRCRNLIATLVVAAFVQVGACAATVAASTAATAATDAVATAAVASRMPEVAAAPRNAPSRTEKAGVAARTADDARKAGLSGWPAEGSIRYKLMYGDGGLEIGEAQHRWSHDDKRYRMSVAVRTTGALNLIYALQYEQRSEGAVVADGLVPERFSVDQSGKKPETATFDWNAGQVTMRRGTRTRVAPIRHGDQDLLSLWHQVGFIAARGLPHELTIVTGSKAKPSIVERVGDETLSLPIGRVDTLRLRARALNDKLSIDIWLGRAHGMLPLRIRITDEKGGVLDQQAVELHLSPAAENAARAPEPAPARANEKAARQRSVGTA